VKIDFDKPRKVSGVCIAESGVQLGQPGNCRKFSIEAFDGLEWVKIHGSDVIGSYRLCVVDPIVTSSIRLNIEEIADDSIVEIDDMYVCEEMPHTKNAQTRVVGYYHPMAFESGSFGGDIKQLDAVTDVVYIGFMPIGVRDNKLEILFNQDIDDHINSLKKAIAGRNVNIYASLTGHDVLTNNDDDIERIAAQATEFVITHDLYGIDLDLEGQWYTSPVQRLGYSKLIVNLGKKLHAIGKKISIAVITPYPFTSEALDTLDFISTMTYDYTDVDAWHSTYNAVLRDIDILCNIGLPLIDENDNACGYYKVAANKVNCGVPFYGMGNIDGQREWERTYSFGHYYSPGDEANFDPHSNYATQSYYNGPTTMRDKTEYIKNHVGGIMIWALNHDVDYSARFALLRTIKSGIEGSN